MKNNKKTSSKVSTTPRTFTFNQLTRISDLNYGVLNRCIDMSAFGPRDIFILTPRLVHEHAYGEPVEPHLRTLVFKLGEPIPLAYQDLTFEQWEEGKEVHKIAI